MSRNHHDILIDQLLRELLGGDRPRDLTDRVLARARTYDRVRRHWWAGVGSALAASIAIAITLWVLWPRAYPPISVDADALEISNQTETVQRGSRLVTPEDSSATVALGGYVTVDMAPLTVMTIGGSKFDEKVILERGELDIQVARNRGHFTVAVGRALVHVTGTRLQVGVTEEEADDRRIKRLRIAVKEGSVQVEGASETPVILAANSAHSENVFDLSSEPTLVRRPVAPEPLRTGARQGAIKGAALAAGEGGRPGLLTPNYINSTAPRTSVAQWPPNRNATPNRGNGQNRGNNPINGLVPAPAAGRGPVAIIPGRDMRVIIAPGNVEITGTLRREGERLFFLETEAGHVLIFAQQTPQGPARPLHNQVGKRVKVKWSDGLFQSLEPAEPAPQSGTF